MVVHQIDAVDMEAASGERVAYEYIEWEVAGIAHKNC
jgi:hypothetical protein